MKSRFSSEKTTQRRPLLRIMATILSVILLVTSLGLGSIITTNAILLSDAQKVQFEFDKNSGTLDGTSLSGGYNLDFYPSDNNNTWSRTSIYLKTSSGGWDYNVKWQFRFDGIDQEWSSTGVTYTSSSSVVYPILYRNGGWSKLTLGNADNGYKRVDFYVYSNGGESDNGRYQGVKITEYDVDNLSANYNVDSITAAKGSEVSVYPDITGGSGDYNVSYALTIDGDEVEEEDIGEYINNNKLSVGNVVGTVWTVTAEVADYKCPNLTHVKNITKTITVGTPNSVDYYFVSDETKIDGGDTWERRPEYKLNYDSASSSYKLKVYLKDGYQFLIEDQNGNQRGHEDTDRYEIKDTSIVNSGDSSGHRYEFVVDDELDDPFEEGFHEITFDPVENKLSLTPVESAPEYYLTGYWNRRYYSTLSETMAFKATNDPNVFTYTTVFRDTNDTYQYLTVTKKTGYKAYHPDEANASSEGESTVSAGTNPDGEPGGGYKWRCLAPAGTSVTFTWDMTVTEDHPNPTLSWTQYATFKVTYKGRDNSDRTVYLVGTALEATEISSGINLEDDERGTAYWKAQANTVIKNNLGTFMKEFNVTEATVTRDGTNLTQLNINCTGDAVITDKKVTVTAYFPKEDATATDFTTSGTCYYSATDSISESNNYSVYEVVNLAEHVGGKTPEGYHFYAWMEYDDDKDELGRIVSTRQNFNFKATGNITIVAVYKSGPTASESDYDEGWFANIDENRVSAEYTSSTYSVNASEGNYYNDFITRFTNYRTNQSLAEFVQSDQVASGTAQFGILMIYKTEDLIAAGGGQSLEQACDTSENATYLKKYIDKLENGQTGTHNSNKIKLIELDATADKLNNYNRVNLSLKSDVGMMKNAEYRAIAFLKYIATGASEPTYVFSSPVYGSYK